MKPLDLDRLAKLLAEKERAQAEYDACDLSGPDEGRLCNTSIAADRAADTAIFAALPSLLAELAAAREVVEKARKIQASWQGGACLVEPACGTCLACELSAALAAVLK